jgi:hypothetical protein
MEDGDGGRVVVASGLYPEHGPDRKFTSGVSFFLTMAS